MIAILSLSHLVSRQVVNEVPDFGELMQLLVLELIKKICKANPLEKVTEDTA